MRTLALVAGIGLAVSAVCLALAAVLPGDGFDSLPGLDLADGFFSSCPAPVSGNAATTRDLDWQGGDSAAIHVPATVHYRPGAGTMLHASGPADLVSHLQVRDGRVEFDCNRSGYWRYGSELDLTLPGRPFETFSLTGSGHLLLDDLKQPSLRVNIAGSGDVRATGEADTLALNIAGSGAADFGKLAVQSSKVRIAGSGRAALAPKDSANISIAGAGVIRFAIEPRKLETHIAGSGQIISAPGP